MGTEEAEMGQVYSGAPLPEHLFIEMQDTVAQMRLRKAALTELASRI